MGGPFRNNIDDTRIQYFTCLDRDMLSVAWGLEWTFVPPFSARTVARHHRVNFCVETFKVIVRMSGKSDSNEMISFELLKEKLDSYFSELSPKSASGLELVAEDKVSIMF